MKSFYHDVHLHLDLYPNAVEIINHITDFKSYTIAVTNLPVLFDRALKKYKDQKYIRFALGLHPELINQYTEQIPVFFERLKDCRYVGEIGLDFKKTDEYSRKLQVDTFKKIINECNNYGGKILSIHSRSAAKEVIEIIGSNFNGKIILHWFSGTLTELEKAIDSNYFFSINGDMVNSKKGQNIIKRIPTNRLLIESDGPFTKDTHSNYHLSFVDDLIKKLANIRECDSDEMSILLKGNFKNLLE
ncbi:Qat anti-phage system TatD family nuclease QatD [Metabacillus halosaccharovorans]|uniref:Qat anti-phage system TatD family nuclease QatD n=1 Tax=Metabacillus halosaccharovorans TaxID=930124 RepID=UPI001C1FAD54|nr:TatD family deoxyribonuclease [Metabacillus halosaccharovorans]